MKNRISKVKNMICKMFVCLSLMVCCLTGATNTVYANEDLRPEFKTRNNKEYEYGDDIKIKWRGNTDTYLIAVRNLTTDIKVIHNEEVDKESYTITEDLEPGRYKVAIAGCEGSKSYWCSEYLYFDVIEVETLKATIEESEETYDEFLAWFLEESEKTTTVVGPNDTYISEDGGVTGNGEAVVLEEIVQTITPIEVEEDTSWFDDWFFSDWFKQEENITAHGIPEKMEATIDSFLDGYLYSESDFTAVTVNIRNNQ